MNAKVIPIKQVKPNLKDAVRMSVAEIENFLALFYPRDLIRQQKSAHAIAGQWLSRVKGFHDDDDFLYLVRDFLAWVISEGKRSQALDRLSLFFSGFMPDHGTARIFLDILNDGGNWHDVRAFMHSQAYGNAKKYVEEFDWTAGKKKAQDESQAWLKPLREEDGKLSAAVSAGFNAAIAGNATKGGTAIGIVGSAAALPRLGASAAGVASGAGEAAIGTAAVEGGGLLPLLGTLEPFVAVGVLLLYPTEMGNSDMPYTPAQPKDKSSQGAALPAPVITIPYSADAPISTTANSTENACRPQLETNSKNGSKCEEYGYAVMEQVLNYKSLDMPPESKPKGPGLDGLFEKQGSMTDPDPMPDIVVDLPAKGSNSPLIFIPPDKRPPILTKTQSYPRFVVFEAKHISKAFDQNDTEGIQKAARGKLRKTCDGTQMNPDWIERRYPKAIDQSVEGGILTHQEGVNKKQQIRDDGYAAWVFVCLPGPTDSIGSSKLFVLIDVVESGMKLKRRPAQSAELQSDNDTSGSFA